MTQQPPRTRGQELRNRIIVGVVLIALAWNALLFGGIAFWLLAVVAALLMQSEWATLANASPTSKRLSLFALSVPLAILSPLAAGPSFLAIGLLMAAFTFVIAITRAPQLAAGIFYCGLPVAALLYLRDHPQGTLYTFWALSLVWATDIGAYFAGRAIGGPKLAPRISPSKTWAGLGGGVACALLLGYILHQGFALPPVLAAASGLLAAVAQLGDLFESWLKRRVGAKDSGTILGGHGGVLDRLDGLVPVAPIAAIMVALWVAP